MSENWKKLGENLSNDDIQNLLDSKNVSQRDQRKRKNHTEIRYHCRNAYRHQCKFQIRVIGTLNRSYLFIMHILEIFATGQTRIESKFKRRA